MAAPTFDTDPWLVREPRVDPETRAVAESVFTLSNGYVGIRGTLDEVEPAGMRGTYLSGVHELHPLSYPEGGYGQPEEGQAMLTVADGTPLAAQKLERVLTTDPAMGVLRHVDAGYLRAAEVAQERVVRVPMEPTTRDGQE